MDRDVAAHDPPSPRLPPSRCALRRTSWWTGGYGGLKAGMKPPVKKGARALPPHLYKSGGMAVAGGQRGD